MKRFLLKKRQSYQAVLMLLVMLLLSSATAMAAVDPCSDPMPTSAGNAHNVSQTGTGAIVDTPWHYRLVKYDGTANMTYYDNGTFKANWNSCSDVMTSVGFLYNESGVNHNDKVYTADYRYKKTGSAQYGYIGVHGWALNPYAEFYIIDDWYSKPNEQYIGEKFGEIMVDGAKYTIHVFLRQQEGGSPWGTQTYLQFFSVRETPRQCGHIDITAHFKKWDELFTGQTKRLRGSKGGGSAQLKFGSIIELMLMTEAGGNATGSVEYEYFNMAADDVFTITYNGIEGATFETANPTIYKIGSDDIMLNNPTKEGYVFTGWTGTDLNEATKTVTIRKGSTGHREYTATFTPDIATHWQADADHDGSTAEKAYIITTPAGLNLLASEVNSGNSYKNKYFMLGDDITYTHTTDWNDATSTENNYTAIGNNKKYFEGYFDGNGKTVRGIRIYKSGETLGDDNSLGLFGYIQNSGEIKNVILADARITGCASVGGIVGGSNGSPITNCHVLDDVAIHAVKYDAQAHGGIAGATGGNITGCTSAASITTNTGAGECQYFGGIVGYNCGTVSNCLYLGSTINGKMSVGAIVGKNESNGTLQNSYYTSTNISGKNNSGNQLDYTVSAVGHNAGTVTNSGLAYSITLDKDLSIAGDQTVYDVSGLTAYGNTALSYNNGTTTTIYTCKGVTVPLSYGGTVPEDYTFGGYAVKDADNNVVDVSESGGVYSFTMPNKNVNVSTKITRNTTINVEVGNANYMVAGHDAYVVVTMTPDDFNGIATISVTPEGGDSKPYNVAVVNGEGRYVVNNLASSSYTVQASFAGDDNYTASTSVVKQLVVGKIPTTLTISVDRTTFIVGEPITISVVMNEMINAVVTVKVNGENYTLGLVCGKGSITFSHLDVGTYKIDAVYAGDDIYNSYETTLNNKSISVEVKKNNTNIGVEVASPVIAKEVNE